MTLRKQLILVSLCLLALPWAGCQYVKEMESVLRKNQQQLLQSAAQPIAQIVEATVNKNYSSNTHPKNTLYTPYRNSPVAIDGYDDEWKNYSPHPMYFTSDKTQHQKAGSPTTSYFKIAANQNNLLLFFHIKDNNIIYHHPSSPSPIHNDYLKIETGDQTNQQSIVLYTSGQGGIQAVYSNEIGAQKHWKPLPPSQRIQGYWQENVNDKTEGYNIELSIPLSLLSSNVNNINNNIEFSVFNLDTPLNTNTLNVIANRHESNLPHTIAQKHLTSLDLETLGPILTLGEKLSAFQQPSWDIAIVNTQGWLLSPQTRSLTRHSAETLLNKPSTEHLHKQSTSLWEAALSRFYRYIMEDLIKSTNADTTSAHSLPMWPMNSTRLSLSKNQIPIEVLSEHQNQWYKVVNSQRSILSVVNPIRHHETQNIIAYVILTQSSEALLSLTNNALLRIINLSLTTAALSAFILLGFASILSYRIRHLRNQAEKAVSSDGKVQPFSASTAHDEIGDLSRSYALLLQRIQDYNHYLETLSGKLAHELRTPLTISKSSIEMLKMVDVSDPDKQQRYLNRAEEGLERLRLILNAMSEASRVEQVIQHSEIHNVDLAQLMNEMCQAYQHSYPEFTFHYHQHPSLTQPATILRGAPELIAQMLDKLVDNATGFAPKESTIKLSLAPYNNGLRITIDNTGPLLPNNMQQQLFDSMVSIRKEKTDTPHLGLGLYIVKLIAQHHQGKLSASNNKDDSGVQFCVDLPTC